MKNKIIKLVALVMCLLQITSFATPSFSFRQQITGIAAEEICANSKYAFVTLQNSIDIYDISADTVSKVTEIRNLYSITAVADEERLYIGHSAGCGFIDLSTIKQDVTPTITSLVSSDLCSVAVIGKYAFVSNHTDGEVYVRDMSRPKLRYPKIATLGSDYVGMQIDNGRGIVVGSSNITIYNLSSYAGEKDLTSFKMGTLPNPGYVSAVSAIDNYVFITNDQYPGIANRLYAYGLSNGKYTKLWEHEPYGPTADGNRMSDVQAKGDFLYLVSQATRTIYLINITNPKNGVDVMASVYLKSGNHYGSKIAVSGNKVLTAESASGVGVYSVVDKYSDVSNNLNLQIIVPNTDEDMTVISKPQVAARLQVDNYSADDIVGKLILAVYDGDKLKSCTAMDIKVYANRMKQEFETPSSLVTNKNYEIKAMLWEDNTPVMKNITVKKAPETGVSAIYVDQKNGDDRGTGTESSPFATLQRAKAEVRKYNKTMTDDIYVYIADGTYKINNTIEFTAEDSGSNGYDVIYKAKDGANPIISGGEKITGWTLHENGIYKAKTKGIDTRQLYVNGVRATRARSSGGLSGVSLTNDGIYCSNTAIANYRHPEDLEFVFKAKWLLPRIKAVSATVSSGRCFIKMQQPDFYDSKNNSVSTIRISSPWYYENAYELLDQPGEFYIDPYTDTVYYKPRTGENMSTAETYLPKTETLFNIKASSMYRPARNITFEGLTFAHTAWDKPNEVGNVQNQNNKGREYESTLAVLVERAENITIKKCTFKSLGGGGLGMFRGCQDCDIIGNEFYDISAWAMDIGEINNPNPKDDRLINDGFEIANNYIHDVAVEYMGASAMTLGHVSNTMIRNNEIYNVPYTAISIGWGFTVYPTTNLKGITIRNNYIHELVNVLDDGGAIYTNGASGATASNPNWIFQNYCKGQYASTSLVYTDEGSCYWLAEQNVLDTRAYYGCYYGSTHEYNIHDITYLNNYTTSSSKLNDGGANCIYQGTYADSSARWNQAAQNIIAWAGLEAEYQYLKN